MAVSHMNQAKRCHATSKRTKLPCQAAAVKGWNVCQHHGAGAGRPKTHGLKSKETLARKKGMRALLASAKGLLESI
ncbi:MAG: hypothetical protein ABL924_06830 [Methyloglobulus sp.]